MKSIYLTRPALNFQWRFRSDMKPSAEWRGREAYAESGLHIKSQIHIGANTCWDLVTKHSSIAISLPSSTLALHWLKLPEQTHFKVLSLTYNLLQYSKPTYLCKRFTIQPTHSTWSSSCLTFSSPTTITHMKFSNQAISITAQCLWNTPYFFF